MDAWGEARAEGAGERGCSRGGAAWCALSCGCVPHPLPLRVLWAGCGQMVVAVAGELGVSRWRLLVDGMCGE